MTKMNACKHANCRNSLGAGGSPIINLELINKIENWKTEMKNAFTLIELLVVIAIIAILASMLLPALKQARNQAKSIICLSSQKQLTMCHINYSLDFQDYALAAWDASASQIWYSVLMETQHIPLPSPDSIKPYALMHCDSRGSAYWDYNTVSGKNYYHFLNYSLNNLIIGGASPYHVKVSRIKKPERTVMFADAAGCSDCAVTYANPFGYNKASYYLGCKTFYDMVPYGGGYPDGIDRRHGNGANISFYDGHATSVNPVTILEYFYRADATN